MRTMPQRGLEDGPPFGAVEKRPVRVVVHEPIPVSCVAGLEISDPRGVRHILALAMAAVRAVGGVSIRRARSACLRRAAGLQFDHQNRTG